MIPIRIIPWNTDFMPTLGDWLAAREDFAELTVLFTHNRPRRYLKKHFAQHPDLPRPCFLPHMTSIADFIGSLRAELDGETPVQAKRLDLAELLHTIVAALRREGRGLLTSLPALDRESFLPWGMELAALMEELLRQDMEPQDLMYMEGEVADYAAALLEQLRTIFTHYVAALDERGWTTPGLDCRFAAQNLERIVEHYRGRPMVAAGFYALSGAENKLLHALWQADVLEVLWHSDPALAHGEKHHWAVAEHVTWMEAWKTRPLLLDDLEIRDSRPAIRFCEGFDRHSQLAALQEELQAAEDHPNTAIVLPDTGALLPVLHHLPDAPVNISMGYPLERSSLARLLETILGLQENRLGNGRYHWKDVINLIRHPYLKMLGDSQDAPLRQVLHCWEAEIRQGSAYLDPFAWAPPYGLQPLEEVAPAQCEPIRTNILRCCLENFQTISSLSSLADALAQLVEMLHSTGQDIWHNFLVDAECLYRLSTSVIPELKGTLTRDETFSKPVLFSILRRLLGQERVSFEPDPITGLQVLGVLETRLLHFRRLFILDAVEEKLPGTSPFDPLLPDPMRKLLGLPDSRERDNVAAYNFYRLLMGAKEAVILYQSGIQPGLLDSKSVRSRFVEQLLWDMEKAKGDLIRTGDPEIRPVVFKSSPVPFGAAAIPATEQIRERLHEKLATKGLTPSLLDTYLGCPKKFFFGYMTRLRPVNLVSEEGDRAEFGSLLHDVLRRFLEPHIGRTMVLSDLDPAPLLELYRETLRASDVYRHLPFDGQTALLHAGRHRLHQFLQCQDTATAIMGLELKATATIKTQGLDIPLTGCFDRLDMRDQGIHILDYKTGSLRKPAASFWENQDIWDRMHAYDPDAADPLLIPDLAKALQSVQLPAYLYLHDHGDHAGECVNAGLVELASGGDEAYLFPNKTNKAWSREEMREVIEDMIPRLLAFLARHIHDAGSFQAVPGRQCQWCDFKGACGQ
ncbi:PD-(D/E)XK nuclease family protein [Salidesulfovibrio onnuriiensis]|uniref:PD-(D/E)XK nuclease family protein n=1 Tax=Salidesulfovibrio onnuriiensis TaxID=2583823 RepID=UPI0011CC035E|nr:PD-(D/E)XK nuclease family protein [Salidesulfovibrio onnuriiensis]